jgi:hypothetical protein
MAKCENPGCFNDIPPERTKFCSDACADAVHGARLVVPPQDLKSRRPTLTPTRPRRVSSTRKTLRRRF